MLFKAKSLNALKNERITEPSLDHSCRKQTGFSVIRHPPFGVTAVKQIVITHIVKFKLGFMNFFCWWRTCTNAKVVQKFELAKRNAKNFPLTTYILV